jgi:phytoene synthase
MDAAESYCEQTSGVLLKLAGHICSPDDMPANMDQMGRAWGLTGLARAWPFYEKSMLQALTFDDICGAARQSHAEARKEKISPAYIPICAYIALIPGFLKRLENSPQTEQSDQPIYSPFARRFRLLKTVMTGQI